MGRPLKKGCRMRDIRVSRGLSLEDVARATHYTQQTLLESEIGHRNHGAKKDIRRDTFWMTMSKFYGIPADELRRWHD